MGRRPEDGGLSPPVSHERVYPPIDTPSLTCHVVIRLLPDDDPATLRDVAAINTARCQRINRLNELLARLDRGNQGSSDNARFAFPTLLESLSDEDATGSGITPVCPTATRYPDETLNLSLKPFGQFNVGLLVEINPEFTTLSFRASPLRPDNPSCDTATLAQTKGAYARLLDIMRGDICPDSEGECPEGQVPADTALNQIFAEFWNNFFCWTVADADRAEWLKDGRQSRHRLFGGLGKQEVEFQGVLLRAHFDPSNPQGTGAADFDHAMGRINAAELRPVREIQYPNDRGPPMQVDNEAQAAIRRRLVNFVNKRPNVLTRILGFRSNDPTRRLNSGNAVLCHFFEGQAIYGSSLSRDDQDVVRFFLVYGGPSSHQLGRLLMLLHHCGELRFACLFEWRKLEQASELIRMLDMDLSDAVRPNVKKLRRYNRQLGAIAKLGRGGLAFRAARLTFYANALRALLKHLRVERIPGWQTYSGFIKRNVSRRLDRYVEVGGRFAALQARVRQESNSSVTRYLTRVTKHMDDQQSAVLDLQSAGETFAILASGYYVGAMVYELVAFLLTRTGQDGAGHDLKFVAFAIGVCIALWSRYVLFERRRVRTHTPVGAIGILAVESKPKSD